MSHAKERKEKDCLNCGAAIYGRYCHICGQENIDTHESFRHLVAHFIFDIFHYDGKFFSTIKNLLLKPGFLSTEHLRGRRASYLHPIKLYVFTSAFFFLLYFSFFQSKPVVTTLNEEARLTFLQRALAKKDSLEKIIALKPNNVKAKELLEDYQYDIAILEKEKKVNPLDLRTVNDTGLELDLSFSNKRYQSVEDYQKDQNNLPKEKQDGYLERIVKEKSIIINQKYNYNGRAILQAVIMSFRSKVPQMMFVSLPVFSWFLYLLYKRNHQILYVNNVVFSIHLYCGFFITIFIALCLNKIFLLAHLKNLSNILSIALNIYLLYFTYKSLRNFYQQTRLKTILKLIATGIFTSILFVFLFAFYFLFSAFTL